MQDNKFNIVDMEVMLAKYVQVWAKIIVTNTYDDASEDARDEWYDNVT